MKSKILIALSALAAMVMTSSQVQAWDVSGCILCPNGVPYQNVTVTVTGTNCNGSFSSSGMTGSGGCYQIVLPQCCGSYMACIDTAALPADATVTGSACVSFTVCDTSMFATVNWEVNSSGCGQGCPACVDPQLGLGAAAGCTVLELGRNKVSITGPAGGILGDICIAPNGGLAMSGDEFVTGIVKLGPGASFSNSSHGTANVERNVDLSAEINAAYAAYANAAGLPCSQSYAKLDGHGVTTITGSVGVNVICVGDVVLSGKQIYVTGPAGARFVFNVMGKFALTGGGAGPQIRASGGVQPKDILYNIIGTGEDVAFSGGGGGENCCAAIVDGTLLAPYRKINLSPGLVNGEVISGENINIVSGSSVRCPPCP